MASTSTSESWGGACREPASVEGIAHLNDQKQAHLMATLLQLLQGASKTKTLISANKNSILYPEACTSHKC